MNIEYISPRQLTPYWNNAKEHPQDQVARIANSIREFGFKQPIVIDANNVVIIGHGRLMAANRLGLDAVPCVRADDLTEEQVKALRLADNKTNESGWNFAALEVDLADLEGVFDMSDFGFAEMEYQDDAEEPQEQEPTEKEPENETAIVKLHFEKNEAEEVKEYIHMNGEAGLVMACLNFIRRL